MGPLASLAQRDEVRAAVAKLAAAGRLPTVTPIPLRSTAPTPAAARSCLRSC